MIKEEKFKEIEGKTIKNLHRKENGCLILTFTDDTFIGIFNKAEIIEGNLELGINIYN